MSSFYLKPFTDESSQWAFHCYYANKQCHVTGNDQYSLLWLPMTSQPPARLSGPQKRACVVTLYEVIFLILYGHYGLLGQTQTVLSFSLIRQVSMTTQVQSSFLTHQSSLVRLACGFISDGRFWRVAVGGCLLWLKLKIRVSSLIFNEKI